MNPVQDMTLSERHLALFGAIVQCFAYYDELMDELIARQGGGSATAVKLLTASLDFEEKRLALLNLMRHRNVAMEHYDEIARFLAVPRTHAGLRGDIIHSVWIKSLSDNAIHPKWLSHGPVEAVRPVHDIDSSGQTFKERPEDQATYTLDELGEISGILWLRFEEFRNYLKNHDLIKDHKA